MRRQASKIVVSSIAPDDMAHPPRASMNGRSDPRHPLETLLRAGSGRASHERCAPKLS